MKEKMEQEIAEIRFYKWLTRQKPHYITSISEECLIQKKLMKDAWMAAFKENDEQINSLKKRIKNAIQVFIENNVLEVAYFMLNYKSIFPEIYSSSEQEKGNE